MSAFVQDKIKFVLQKLLMLDVPKVNKVSAVDAVDAPQHTLSATSTCENDVGDGTAKAPPLIGRSLMVLGPQNPFRLFLAKIVWHPRFEHIIIVLIFCSSIVLALDSPSVPPDSVLKTILVRCYCRHFCSSIALILVLFNIAPNIPGSGQGEHLSNIDLTKVVCRSLLQPA